MLPAHAISPVRLSGVPDIEVPAALRVSHPSRPSVSAFLFAVIARRIYVRKHSSESTIGARPKISRDDRWGMLALMAGCGRAFNAGMDPLAQGIYTYEENMCCWTSEAGFDCSAPMVAVVV